MHLLRPLTIAGFLLISACYQQPVISPQRPLRCTPSEVKSECPKGFTCVPAGVCAPNSCQRDQDCPVGLVCSSRGCVSVPDGGSAGNGDGAIQIPVVPDGGAGVDAPPAPEAGPMGGPDVFSPDLFISPPVGGAG